MTLRWFLSGKVRHATDVCKQVDKMLNSQRDLLSPQAISDVQAALDKTKDVINSKADSATIDKALDELEKNANKNLKPYPNPEWRENIEVLLVAIAVAMAIRTFFVQPFKIPTGSMQPTLFGVTTENFRNQPDVKFPTGFQKFVDSAVHGEFYHELRAPRDCQYLGAVYSQFLRFINKHEIYYRYPENGTWVTNHITMWFSPDERLTQPGYNWSGLVPGQEFRQGDYMVKLKEVAGDHLFVDRLTYNFRHPQRGEIIVFKTAGIPDPRMRQDQFYIKRLVALGGETVRIGNDRHIYIDGKRLDANTPHFANVYGGGMASVPQDSVYSGHINGFEYFPSAEATFQVPPGHYMVMGDNTMSSFDSRSWGPFPRENVIGKSFFVYWPISNRGSSRFGLGYQ